MRQGHKNTFGGGESQVPKKPKEGWVVKKVGCITGGFGGRGLPFVLGSTFELFLKLNV